MLSTPGREQCDGNLTWIDAQTSTPTAWPRASSASVQPSPRGRNQLGDRHSAARPQMGGMVWYIMVWGCMESSYPPASSGAGDGTRPYHQMAQSSARACLMPCRSQRASAVRLSRVSSQLLERERCAYARGRMSKGALGIMLECDLVGLGQSGVSHLDRGEWGCSRGEF